MTTPPDRQHVDTEQSHPGSVSLAESSVASCLELITREDYSAVNAVRAALPQLETFVGAVAERFARAERPGRLIYVGAGTSGRLGVLDASEAPPTFCVEPGRIVGIIAGGDAALRLSSEGKEDQPDGARAELERLALTDADAVLGIAAGGTTPYPRGALAIAKSIAPGCVTGLLTCSRVSTPAGCDHLIVLPTGPEVLTGSTRMKAGTATKLALNAISTTLMVQSGRVYKNLMVDVRASNDKLRDRAARVIATVTGLERAAALEALDAAGGSAKVAIVMTKRRWSRADAEGAIAKFGPRLGDVLAAD